MQQVQVEYFIDSRAEELSHKKPQLPLLPNNGVKLRCWSPFREEIFMNKISLPIFLRKDRQFFKESYDNLIELLYNPKSPEAQTFIT